MKSVLICCVCLRCLRAASSHGITQVSVAVWAPLLGVEFWAAPVAEGKRKTPQKIASKGAKICKKSPHFGVQKWTRFGVCLFFFKRNKPQNGSIFGPQNGVFFYIFLRLLMQFFAGFSFCLPLRMLYSYVPVD